MGQEPFYSPTVFSYYRPNYVIPGTTLLGPEFTIQSSNAAIQRANFINTMVFSRIGTPPNGTSIDLTGSLQALSISDPTGNALVNELDRLLMHGTMSSGMRTKILQTITALGTTTSEHLKRARWALYLVATSSQYQIAR
jgi:hypothetical protein